MCILQKIPQVQDDFATQRYVAPIREWSGQKISLSQGCFCTAEGRWRLYYAGLKQEGGPAQGIGLAMTDKEDMEEFEGVRVAFRRRV